MSGFHRCVTCEAKLPANDPHEDCVACLGPEHAASASADRSFCALCANFQPRTLRKRARKSVGSHSPSSWSSYILSVPPSNCGYPGAPPSLQLARDPQGDLWGPPTSSPSTSWKASTFAMQGASEAGLASFSPVDAAFAALTVQDHGGSFKKDYSAATEAVRLSIVASLLSVYQASLVKDLPENPSVSLRVELALVAQLLVKIAQLNAQAQGRSIASLVVARRQLWLSQARVQEPEKAPLLHAPITPGHTFGPAVEEMLQRSAKAWEAFQQMAKMWPHKPSLNANKSTSGVEHHRSTSHGQGVLRPLPQVQQGTVNLHLQDRSVEGGALEEVAGHTLVALARPLTNGRSQNRPENSRQLLTHPYTVPQLQFWQQCTNDIWVRKTIFTGYMNHFFQLTTQIVCFFLQLTPIHTAYSNSICFTKRPI
ncbi:UNVERIFIED_CONTAM: hypothetical protein FKN15_052904 [Acipenser sinensis]